MIPSEADKSGLKDMDWRSKTGLDPPDALVDSRGGESIHRRSPPIPGSKSFPGFAADPVYIMEKEICFYHHWLNRNVFAIGLTSILSDFCHEMATAVLPQFMQAIGSSAAALGFIERTADALSSFVKLGAGYHSDKIGHRKPWTVLGYVLTGSSKALFAFAFGWPLILLGRSIGWLGRGIRGPLRDAILAESVSAQERGKAFGLHRVGDTIGAIIGPLAAFGLLSLIAAHPKSLLFFESWVPVNPGGRNPARADHRFLRFDHPRGRHGCFYPEWV